MSSDNPLPSENTRSQLRPNLEIDIATWMLDHPIDLYDHIGNAIDREPGSYNWAHKKTAKRLISRVRLGTVTRRHLAKRYAHAFQAFDAALASADFSNRTLIDVLHHDDSSNADHSLLGLGKLFGGPLAYYMLLIGMQARMIRIAAEISLLLRSGFPEGAAARSRTLYELVIKTLVIVDDPSPSRLELAERYYTSALIRGVKEGLHSDEANLEVIEEAKRRWGAEFWKGENNWALPVAGERANKRVSFSDLERAVNAENHHHWYLESNASIHAGASEIIAAGDLRRYYPYNSNCQIDLHATGRVGHGSAFYLEQGVYAVTWFLSGKMRQPDCIGSLSDFIPRINKAIANFRGGYEHPRDQGS